MLISKEKDFYKLILSIALPIAVQNLINFAVGMIDTMMLGSLGEIQLSAAAIGNNLFFILMVLMFGLAGGSNILISQYWGKGDVKSIHKILALMYRACIIITSIFIGIAMFIPSVFIKLYTSDINVIEAGSSYLRIVAIGYIFYAITNCTIMILRSVKTVKISLVVYTTSLIVNAFFNWVFIFGKLGAPALGVKGAAIATVMARIAEFIIVMCFMIFFEDKINLKVKHLLKVDKVILKDYVANCTPVLFNELLWSSGSTMISIIIGRLGTETVAANSISNVVFNFVTVFIFGLSNATAVIIGNTIGEGRNEKAKEYARTIGVLSILMGLMAAGVIQIIKPYVVDFYNVSALTKNIAIDLMSVTSIIVIFQSLGINLMMGVLRGGGDAKFVLINDIIFMWVVAIPLGFIAAFVLKWPVAAVFFIVKSDEIIKSIISVIRVLSGKWVRNLTRDFA
ncbi:MATE family efflux transporter [Clostridium sp. NSJ-6]|uniref:MATE family efflux transporter n=1 Tax=Clostridium hominis TaxID=2763036 RepID=A0ABR7D7R4_9CLOT|nr:MATE family efflux transporter [Clostridium hominis]MBC5627373.1 MATE family efflux transporter [Clostridium hominis]